MLAPGCDVAGRVVDSVLGPGVVVEAGAWVEDSVVFEDVRIEKNARVHTSIVDERSVVGRDATVGALPEARIAKDEDVALVGRDSTIGNDAGIPAGARLEPGTTA
jgi:glucose-1-phosphate adenylyltransferase